MARSSARGISRRRRIRSSPISPRRYNVVQFTTYLIDDDDIAKFMAWRKRQFPTLFPSGNYPPNTLLIVSRLVNPAFRLEVQTIAAR